MKSFQLVMSIASVMQYLFDQVNMNSLLCVERVLISGHQHSSAFARSRSATKDHSRQCRHSPALLILNAVMTPVVDVISINIPHM